MTETTQAEFELEAMPYASDLYRTALRLLQDSGKANDAVQETYLLAWKSFERYQRGTNCKAWLYQILFNVVRHERRTWFKWVTGREEDVAETMLAAAILAALDRIPRQFRECVLLVDVDEFSYKEASEMLRVPIGTVMSRLNRGRGLLRDELATVAASYGIGHTRAQAVAQQQAIQPAPHAHACKQITEPYARCH